MVKRPPLDLDVVRAVPDGARPRVQVKFVEAGDLYLTWRWEHAPEHPRVLGLPRSEVQPALTALAAAVPSPLPGETPEEAMERALGGAFGHRDLEIQLTSALARALLPWYFAMELNDLLLRGIRTHVRIQPCPSLAQVPWEALRVDEGERFVHNGDVSVLPPAGVRNALGRTVSPYSPDAPVVAVLDPPVPGGGRALGRVLAPVTPDSVIGAALAAHDQRLVVPGQGSANGTADTAVSGVRVDRDALQSSLDGASRLLYVGHVTTSGHALDARMHLSCGAELPGRAVPTHGHRPLTAADLAYGHRPGQPWRFPNRVALIACDSAGDGRFAEPTGLVTVMVRGGAEVVTAARWTLPTDAGLEQLTGQPSRAFSDTVVAVDRAHESDDPVATLATWQRDRADRWESTGDVADSPLLWGALTTAFAPAAGSSAAPAPG